MGRVVNENGVDIYINDRGGRSIIRNGIVKNDATGERFNVQVGQNGFASLTPLVVSDGIFPTVEPVIGMSQDGFYNQTYLGSSPFGLSDNQYRAQDDFFESNLDYLNRARLAESVQNRLAGNQTPNYRALGRTDIQRMSMNSDDVSTYLARRSYPSPIQSTPKKALAKLAPVSKPVEIPIPDDPMMVSKILSILRGEQ